MVLTWKTNKICILDFFGTTFLFFVFLLLLGESTAESSATIKINCKRRGGNKCFKKPKKIVDKKDAVPFEETLKKNDPERPNTCYY